MNLHNTIYANSGEISEWAKLKIDYIFNIFKINGKPPDSSACIYFKVLYKTCIIIHHSIPIIVYFLQKK